MRGCISGVFRRVDKTAPEAVSVQGIGMAEADDLVKAVRQRMAPFSFQRRARVPHVFLCRSLPRIPPCGAEKIRLFLKESKV